LQHLTQNNSFISESLHPSLKGEGIGVYNNQGSYRVRYLNPAKIVTSSIEKTLKAIKDKLKIFT